MRAKLIVGFGFLAVIALSAAPAAAAIDTINTSGTYFTFPGYDNLASPVVLDVADLTTPSTNTAVSIPADGLVLISPVAVTPSPDASEVPQSIGVEADLPNPIQASAAAVNKRTSVESPIGTNMALPPTPVPEPATAIVWSLLAAGSWLGTGVARRRKQPAGRWSPESRQAIYDVVGRG